MKNITKNLASLGIGIVFTFIVVFTIRGSSYFIDIIEDFRGYDYEPKMAQGYDWIGPKSGEVIDLHSLKDDVGISIAQRSDNNLTLLTVVDPACAACRGDGRTV